jgi:hypothetical protein
LVRTIKSVGHPDAVPAVAHVSAEPWILVKPTMPKNCARHIHERVTILVACVFDVNICRRVEFCRLKVLEFW